MRIGLDAHILGKGKGGVERVVRQMVRRLPALLPEHRFVVFVNRRFVPDFPAGANVTYRRLPVSNPLWQRSLALPWLSARNGLHLLHVQRAAPPAVRARLLVHAHDLLPLTAPADHRGLRDRLVRLLTPASLRRADRVLTVSQSMAAEIRTLFPDTAAKLAAIPDGVDTEFFRPRGPGAAPAGPAGEYVLYLGALVDRKNLEVAIQGFVRHRTRRLERGGRDLRLVLAGMCRSRAYEARLRGLAADIGGGSIDFAGFVGEDRCLQLLQHARAFLAPSRGEGFDLPALEAAACGVPVIGSDLPVHRELLGDDALYFNAERPDELAAALERLDREPGLRARLSHAGPQRTARYSWPSAMASMAQLYGEMLQAPRRARLS